jgi:hypothetical protein
VDDFVLEDEDDYDKQAKKRRRSAKRKSKSAASARKSLSAASATTLVTIPLPISVAAHEPVRLTTEDKNVGLWSKEEERLFLEGCAKTSIDCAIVVKSNALQDLMCTEEIGKRLQDSCKTQGAYRTFEVMRRNTSYDCTKQIESCLTL